jgi:hypothetical protein
MQVHAHLPGHLDEGAQATGLGVGARSAGAAAVQIVDLFARVRSPGRS